MRPEFRYQYEEIAWILKEEILRGDFADRGRLPSERLLVERFKVQRNTVRQALDRLEREGQISTEGKRGSFLRPLPTHADGKSFLVNIHGGFSLNLARLKDGFLRTATEAGYQVRLVDSRPAVGAALDPIPDARVLDRDIAGAVVWPQNPTDLDALNRLNETVPTVLVDRRVTGLSLDCVRFADLAGGRMVAEHLIAEGHRRIGFISDDVFAETVQHRWHGYAMALEQADIPIDPRLTLFFHGLDAPFYSLSIRYILGLRKAAPTAIICSNDVVAFTLLRFLHGEGIRVPDDLAVTGYGDSMPDYSNAMSLTTVHQPFYEMGQAAAKILAERVGQLAAERLRTPHDIEIPVRMVVRGSSRLDASPERISSAVNISA